jgi:glycosyltransferase involved in cell wall biosynthesis
MDLVIVPSEHSKGGFINTLYDKIQNLPDGKQQKIGELKLEKPMEVLFEGADDTYKPLKIEEIDSEFFKMLNEKISEEFAFLFVGQWTQGGYGEDRKDIAKMLKIFYESFANKKKQPALILKTNGATFSTLDKADILKKIKNVKDKFPSDWKLPNVYLLHGDLSKEEMNYLYNHPKVKAMVSFTHGEGFGRPLLEATMTGLPVIASGWSGQLDFLDRDKSLLVQGNFEKIPKSVVWQDIIVEDSQWFTVDETSAYKAFNYVFKNNFDVKKNAKSLMNINREKFNLNKMIEKLDEIVTSHINKVPSHVKLNLPKLKKIGNPEASKIKLPKLKKITEDA